MQYADLGKFIKEKRLSLTPSVSLNRFAIDNEIEPAILSRIENSKQDVKFSVLCKIAKGFKMSASDFIKEFESK